ncbi:MAG TPA: hypothetical protein VK668_15045 [Mucilaginibacter sp.]|nr:hypothetical protein [Mucilaginibacter sp.]
MKNVCFILLVLVLATSCKKSDLPGDNGCINRTRQRYLTGADSLAAVQLLKQNNIPYTNLGFEILTLNDTVKQGTEAGVYQHIYAVQYINGLRVLNNDFGYHFKSGVFQSMSGIRYTAIDLNTQAALSYAQLRKLYLAELDKNGYHAASFKDSCLVAEFGYYNLNGYGYASSTFTKAWAVSPKHAQYPLGYFRDDNGQLLGFYSGFVVF